MESKTQMLARLRTLDSEDFGSPLHTYQPFVNATLLDRLVGVQKIEPHQVKNIIGEKVC